MVKFWKTVDVTAFCKQLKAAGYKVIRDSAAGTVKVWHDDEVVFSAIQKSLGGHWICRINDKYVQEQEDE